MTETKDMRRALIRTATTSLWAFGGAQLTREQAATLLPSWVHADLLDEASRTEVLWHISGDVIAEPTSPVVEVAAVEVAHGPGRYLATGGRSRRNLHGFECICGELFEGASAPRARAALDLHLSAVKP